MINFILRDKCSPNPLSKSVFFQHMVNITEIHSWLKVLDICGCPTATDISLKQPLDPNSGKKWLKYFKGKKL